MPVGRREFKPLDWVVVCAVLCEPVSTRKFPAIREFYREIRDFLRKDEKMDRETAR